MSLFGSWSLKADGSDILPGIEKLQGVPLILTMKSTDTLTITRQKQYKNAKEEDVVLTIASGKVTNKRTMQMNVLNIESSGSEVIYGIVQNCDVNFHELTLTRLGPKCGQNSKEVYRMDPNGLEMKISVEVTSPEGVRFSLVKYFSKAESVSAASNNSQLINFESNNSMKSMGWKIFEFWPSTVLTSCRVRILNAIKVKTIVSKDGLLSKSIEKIWSNNDISEPEASGISSSRLDDGLSIAEHYGEKTCKVTNGEEVVKFVIEVTLGKAQWFVTHRYSDFDALRKFVISQNPFNTSFKECDAKFPGKVVGLSYRHSVLEQRIQGLEYFLLFFLDNARYCRQNSWDALLSFLEIPEHLQSLSHDLVTQTIQSDDNSIGSKFKEQRTESVAASNNIRISSSASVSSAQDPVINRNNSDKQSSPKIKAIQAGNNPINTVSTMSNGNSPTSPTHDNPDQVLIALCESLKNGILVIKHGRQGNPKRRLLRTDDSFSQLFWQADGYGSKHESNKSYFLSEMFKVIRGFEIDPINNTQSDLATITSSNKNALTSSSNHDDDDVSIISAASKRSSIRVGRIFNKSNGTPFGSSSLRKRVKESDIPLCIVIFFPSRTVDIQCLNQSDCDTIYFGLKEISNRNSLN
eukprot:gene5262-7311_t